MAIDKRKNTYNVKDSILKLLSSWGFTWEGLYTNKKGEWLLLLQIIILIAHILPRWPTNINLSPNLSKIFLSAGLLILALGLILSTKALIDLGPNLSPLAEPKENARLVIKNSYKICRHPIYLSLLILSTGIVLYKLSIIHFILLIFLTIILKKKAIREEKSLIKIYPKYNEYLRDTPAIISLIGYLDWRQ